MDSETRGIVSQIINAVFKNQKILETVNWVFESDDRITSKEDLALGYFIGTLMTSAVDVATESKLNKKNRQVYEKRLEQIYGKQEASKKLREMDAKIKERRAKIGTHMTIELAEEEIKDIRNMLIPMISRFREKIRKEIRI